MRLIFLDIDGVLNNQIMYEHYKDQIIETASGQIDPRCIGLLNDLTDAIGAKIVLSSTWRKYGDAVDDLKNAGITADIISVTPWGLGIGALRGNEILQWMENHAGLLGCEYYEYDDYVIIDDDSDMLLWQKNNYFNVDSYCGLTPNLIYKIKLFFKRGR